jgi:hypothetical protein
MALQIGKDIADTIERASYCFWLPDDGVDRSLSLTVATLVVVVTALNLSLLGESNSTFAGAVYAIYLLLSFSVVGVLVFLRTGAIAARAMMMLIEAYVVILLITMLLMTHNLFWPIPFFSPVDARPERSELEQFFVVYAYTLPGAAYLFANSYRQVSIANPAATDSPELVAAQLRLARVEVATWALVHYAVIGFLIWMFLFAKPTTINNLGKLFPSLG